MKKEIIKMKKYYDGEVFIIDEKDSELFERAKEQSDDIYFLIENLEFLRVSFVIESDLERLLKEVFLELVERFESTENLQAMETLLNYFEDFDFGFSDENILEITSIMIDVIDTIK